MIKDYEVFTAHIIYLNSSYSSQSSSWGYPFDIVDTDHRVFTDDTVDIFHTVEKVQTYYMVPSIDKADKVPKMHNIVTVHTVHTRKLVCSGILIHPFG